VEGNSRPLHLKQTSEAVSIDLFADYVIKLTNKMKQEKSQNIRDIFEASDLNHNKDLEYKEVKVILKLFSENTIKPLQLFKTYCPDGNDMNLAQFEQMCNDHELFTAKASKLLTRAGGS
jgi:Ca2+-binding EF-hand superfamily protein